ncbi:hypothetical protein FRC07_010700 [Ceratobasidium sp. 392]|nr:hypothetical protein FRC07_010700 [Ceratobasidium sp. 392]
MPPLVQSIIKNRKSSLSSSHQPSVLPTLSGRAPSTISASQPTASEPWRSGRACRPSARQVESDAYLSSSQAPSRPPTPSEPKPKRKSKKQKSSTRGEPGNRPGLIIQPATNPGTTSHESSPEPVAAPKSQLSDTDMANQSPAGNSIEYVTREEAVRLATKRLGTDASHLSDKTLNKVLAGFPGSDEEDSDASPMELEGGSAPAVLQPAGRVVLESGYQQPTTAAADAQGSSAQPAGGADRSLALNRSHLAGPANPDTATEPESEPEEVEIRPEDSVSQCLLPTSQPLRASPVPSHPLPTPTIRAPTAINTTKQLNRRRADTDTSDESGRSDSDSDHGNSRTSKRRRLARLTRLRPAPTPGHSLPRPPNILAAPRRPSQPSNATNAVAAPSTHSASVRAAPPAAPKHAPAPTTIISRPPPASSPTAVLAWARQQAEKAGTGSPNVDFGLLAQTLGDLGTRLAEPAPEPRRRARRLPSQARKPTDLVEDDAEIMEAETALELGVRARRRLQPALSDFTGVPHYIATRTIPKLNALACARGIYECFGTVCEWIDECYEDVWAAKAPLVPYQKPPHKMKGILAHRLSWVRGDIRGRVDPKVPINWGFVDPPRTSEDLLHNSQLAKSLLPDRFIFRDPKTDTDPYEHPGLANCIAAGLFWGPESIALTNRNLFDPLPIPAIAMILTTTQHCIKQWKTGRSIKVDLSASKQLTMYRRHLEGLLLYKKQAPGRFNEFRRDWFWYGADYGGVPFKDEAPDHGITWADRIRPDSPDHARD